MLLVAFSGRTIADEIAISPDYSWIVSTKGKFYKPSLGANLEYDWQWGKYWSTVFISNYSFSYKPKKGTTISGTLPPSNLSNHYINSFPDPMYYWWEKYGYKGGLSNMNLALNLRVGTPRNKSLRFYFDFGPGFSKLNMSKYISEASYTLFNSTDTYFDGTDIHHYGNWDTTTYNTSIPAQSKIYFSANSGVGLLFDINSNITGGIELRQYIIFSEADTLGILNCGIKLTYRFGGEDNDNRWPNTVNTENFPAPRSYIRKDEEGRNMIANFDLKSPSEECGGNFKNGEINPAQGTYEAYMKNAEDYLAQSDWENAFNEFGSASESISADDERQVYILERQGLTLLKRKNYTRAKRFYVAAIKIGKRLNIADSNMVNAYLGLAHGLRKTGNIKMAIANYQAAFRITNNPEVKLKIKKVLKKLMAAQ